MSKDKSNIDQKKRYEMCKSCEHFYKPTRQCSLCGCQMAIKTHIPEASCPIGKW
jgi:rRNA maturation endonuclease Nob1